MPLDKIDPVWPLKDILEKKSRIKVFLTFAYSVVGKGKQQLKTWGYMTFTYTDTVNQDIWNKITNTKQSVSTGLSKCFVKMHNHTFLKGSTTLKQYRTHVPFTFSVIMSLINAFRLRVLSECLILIGSAMFDATFNLVTRVGLP